MDKKKLTPGRYIKMQGVNGTTELAEFLGISRYGVNYRFKFDRELLDSDIARYLAAKKGVAQ